jgi:hypothetical protein
MADSDEGRQLDHRAHMFQNTVLLMLLEAGIQAKAASSLREARSQPGVRVWRQFVCIMVFANFPSLARSEAKPRSMARLKECARALRRDFVALWGVDATVELIKLERDIDLAMLTVLLPTEAQQRALAKHRLRGR